MVFLHVMVLSCDETADQLILSLNEFSHQEWVFGCKAVGTALSEVYVRAACDDKYVDVEVHALFGTCHMGNVMLPAEHEESGFLWLLHQMLVPAKWLF